MSHWFDNLCLRIAGDQQVARDRSFDGIAVARRGFLKGVLSGTTMSLLDLSSTAWAQAPSPRQVKIPLSTTIDLRKTIASLSPDQCRRSWDGPRMTQAVKFAQGGVTFQQTLNFDSTTKSLTNTIVIMQGRTPVISATGMSLSGGTAKVSINYGAAVSGVRSATFTSIDGKRLIGTIDGRTVNSISSPNSAVQTEFLDHRPAPIITASSTLGTTVGVLAKALRSKVQACHTVTAAPAARGALRAMDYKPGGNGPGDPGDGWHSAGGTYSSPDCDGCWNNCGDKAREYSGIEDWETYICAPCFAAAMIAFNGIWLVCWGTCQLPGGGCCPVPCGGLGTCCGRNEHCFHDGLCCPTNMVVCNNACCGPNISTCAADGTCGCPTGMLSCETQCCAAGEICCNGLCAPAGGCDNGCLKPSHFCNGTCCAPFSSCCNGQCCGQVCVNNTCCPSARVCGNTCCANGQVCNNGSCFGCKNGPGIRASLACHSLGPNNVTLGVCCSASSPTCCGGVCCGVGQNYCVAAHGTYVCTNVNPNPIN